MNAVLVISERDNVATALEPLDAGRMVTAGTSIVIAAEATLLFEGTIRSNLLYAAPGASAAAVRQVLELFDLAGLVDSLPRGLETPVGERGTTLSGGQRQRLALARALLADFPVLVLDEPAEHLDLATADALTADLLAATEGRTTVLITHRLTGLDAVDEVLVLDRGRVVQRGWWPRPGRCSAPATTAPTASWWP